MQKIFIEGVKEKGATANSFTILADGYTKDTWDIFYDGQKIKGASTNSFTVLRNGYAKDSWDGILRCSKNRRCFY